MKLSEYTAGLQPLARRPFPTHYSRGAQKRAEVVFNTVKGGFDYLNRFFPQESSLPLLVLNSRDWKKRLGPAIPYGAPLLLFDMLHTGVGYDDSVLETLRPGYKKAPKQLKTKLASLLGGDEMAFEKALQVLLDFGLIHELTHSFGDASRVGFNSNWLVEFFGDYLMYSHMRESWKDKALIVDALADIYYEGAKPLIKYTRLEDFETIFNPRGFRDLLLNFVWFHGKFLRIIREIYEKKGESFITETIENFRDPNTSMVEKMETQFSDFGERFAKP